MIFDHAVSYNFDLCLGTCSALYATRYTIHLSHFINTTLCSLLPFTLSIADLNLNDIMDRGGLSFTVFSREKRISISRFLSIQYCSVQYCIADYCVRF